MTRKIQTLSPAAAAKLVETGAVLVDVREPDEHARERAPGAVNHPLSAWDAQDIEGPILVFHCRSGARTAMNAERLGAKAAGRDCYIIEGGLDAWREAGLPVSLDRKAPLDLQRQVQIAAGGTAALGSVLALTISPGFLVLPLFVGAGLTLAGLTGFCGLARLLVHAPWNRPLARTTS